MKSLQKHLGFLAIPLLMLIAGLIAVVFPDTILKLSPAGRATFTLIVSVVPGLLWLYFFYLQDKYDKEPKAYLVGVFILGGLLAYAFSMPLEALVQVSVANVAGSLLVKFINAVLLVGCIQEFSKFLTVRYTVYFSREFNEPADGIIYAAAAGLGFAAVYNFVYCINLPSINLSVVLLRVVEQYLVSAVFAGVMGYFMGEAKFAKKNKELLMIVGFLSTAILNGLYSVFTDLIQGMQFEAWKNLLISGVMVSIVYGVLYVLLQKALEESKFKKRTV
jgi:RsiW-degrading membrane proteinase PrsW (M82 family)